jgi:hypothetical protein
MFRALFLLSLFCALLLRLALDVGPLLFSTTPYSPNPISASPTPTLAPIPPDEIVQLREQNRQLLTLFLRSMTEEPDIDGNFKTNPATLSCPKLRECLSAHHQAAKSIVQRRHELLIRFDPELWRAPLIAWLDQSRDGQLLAVAAAERDLAEAACAQLDKVFAEGAIWPMLVEGVGIRLKEWRRILSFMKRTTNREATLHEQISWIEEACSLLGDTEEFVEKGRLAARNGLARQLALPSKLDLDEDVLLFTKDPESEPLRTARKTLRIQWGDEEQSFSEYPDDLAFFEAVKTKKGGLRYLFPAGDTVTSYIRMEPTTLGKAINAYNQAMKAIPREAAQRTIRDARAVQEACVKHREELREEKAKRVWGRIEMWNKVGGEKRFAKFFGGM